MPPRIAIPLPHSADLAYSERALPQYERAVEQAGGTPVRIPLDLSSAEIVGLAGSCDGVLLPGSNADLEPSRFRAPRSSHTAAADLRREAADNLLLENAYSARKPVLGICYGLQSLNVFRAGSLIQHIPDFLPEATRTRINHEAGKTVPVAHSVAIADESLLQQVISGNQQNPRRDGRIRPSSRAQLGSAKVYAGTATPGSPADRSSARKNREAHDQDGHDQDAYGRDAYDREGHGRDAYDQEGHSRDGHDQDAYGPEGHSRDGQGQDGYDREGHDQDANDQDGHDREGHGFNRAAKAQKVAGASAPEGSLIIPVNSSHHQSADSIGHGLRIVARCPDDGIIEALEGTAPDHFVLAVQWHPERSVDDDEPSRAIFRAFISAAI